MLQLSTRLYNQLIDKLRRRLPSHILPATIWSYQNRIRINRLRTEKWYGIVELLIFIASIILGSPTLQSIILGAAFLLVGFTFRFAAKAYPKHASQLMRSGPYQFVRHPYLLGRFLSGAGTVIAAKSALLVAVYSIVNAFLIQRHVRRSEHLLLTHFGAEYSRYSQKVSAFFPQLIGHGIKDVEATGSMKRAWNADRHAEPEALFFQLLIFGVFAFDMIRLWEPWHKYIVVTLFSSVGLYLLYRRTLSDRNDFKNSEDSYGEHTLYTVS